MKNYQNLGILLMAFSGTFAPSEIEGVESEDLVTFDERSITKATSSNNVVAIGEVDDDFETINVLGNFIKTLASKSKDLEPDFQEIVNRRFWDMI